jgi:hypothetical protein
MQLIEFFKLNLKVNKMKKLIVHFYLTVIFLTNISFINAQQFTASHLDPQLFINNQSIERDLLANVYAHTEPASETNPSNANNILMAFNSTYPQTYPTNITQGIKFSTNAGVTWTTIDALPPKLSHHPSHITLTIISSLYVQTRLFLD